MPGFVSNLNTVGHPSNLAFLSDHHTSNVARKRHTKNARASVYCTIPFFISYVGGNYISSTTCSHTLCTYHCTTLCNCQHKSIGRHNGPPSGYFPHHHCSALTRATAVGNAWFGSLSRWRWFDLLVLAMWSSLFAVLLTLFPRAKGADWLSLTSGNACGPSRSESAFVEEKEEICSFGQLLVK